MKATIGIIKQVDREESRNDITEDVLASYPGTTLDFFMNNGNRTGTIKLIFKDHNTYNEAMTAGGLKICGVKYRMEEFHSKPKVIRCYKCQSYGHIAPKCRSKEAKCGKCCQVGHQSNECNAKVNDPTCLHCKGHHYTGSKDCKEYKLVEEKISLQYIKYGL